MKKHILVLIFCFSFTLSVYAVEDNSLIIPTTLNIVNRTNSSIETENGDIKMTSLERLYGPYTGGDFNIYYQVYNTIGTTGTGLFGHNSGYSKTVYRAINGYTDISDTPMPSDEISLYIGTQASEITSDPVNVSILYEIRYYDVPNDYNHYTLSGEFIHYDTLSYGYAELPNDILTYSGNDIRIIQENDVPLHLSAGAIIKLKLTDLYDFVKAKDGFSDSFSQSTFDYSQYCSSLDPYTYVAFCAYNQGSNTLVNRVPMIKIYQINIDYTMKISSTYNDTSGNPSATQSFNTLFGMFSSATYNQNTVELKFNNSYQCGLELSKTIVGCSGPSISLDFGTVSVTDTINNEMILNRYIHRTETIILPGGAYANKTHVKYHNGNNVVIDSFVKGDYLNSGTSQVLRPTLTILGADENGYRIQLSNNAAISVDVELYNAVTSTYTIDKQSWKIISYNYNNYGQTVTINAIANNVQDNSESQFYNLSSALTTFTVVVGHKTPIVTIDQKTSTSFRVNIKNQNSFTVPMYYNMNGISYYLGYVSPNQTITRTISRLPRGARIVFTAYSYLNNTVSVRYNNAFVLPTNGLEA